MVIQNRWNNQSPVQNRSHQNGVLELRELVTEPTVRRIPQELFSGDWSSRCALTRTKSRGFGSEGEERTGAEREVDEKEEEEEDEGEEGEREQWGSVRWFLVGPWSAGGGSV